MNVIKEEDLLASHDFGFSFTDDKEVKNLKNKKVNLEEGNQDLQSRLDLMKAAIMPLLNNLKQNPDKPNIVWPNRVKKIDEFIRKLEDIYKGKVTRI